jgi:copper homeostasis protein
MKKIIFELCAETIGACLAARDGGANRIELCSALSEDGLTPSHGFLKVAIEESGLPVHGLVRPRGGNFFYSKEEIAMMEEDIRHMRELGAAGVVLGVLQTDNTVDLDVTKRLVDLAGPLEVTFHRAFDQTPSLYESLERVIEAGCDRVLTSGGQSDAMTGAPVLAKLVKQADTRIEVAVGGGLRLSNAAKLAALTNATSFHGSLNVEPGPTAMHVQHVLAQLKGAA